MKDHYDFSKAEQGKYYRPIEELNIPIYLETGVREGLAELARTTGQDLTVLVNKLLDKDLEIIKSARP